MHILIASPLLLVASCGESLPPLPETDTVRTTADLPGTVETNGCKAMRTLVQEVSGAAGGHDVEAMRELGASDQEIVRSWLRWLDEIARMES